MLQFFIIAYVFSSTKLEKRAEQFLPLSKWAGRGREQGPGERNDPNKVCTYEYINKGKEIAKLWKQPTCPTNDEWIKKMSYS
jgi:hypothetical protein